MSEPSAFGFGQFVPGFDFLQNLSKTASAAQPTATAGMPGMASWVAPTLSIEDIDKRIQELKSVLFWLEQNTTALKATIQAMEVQKMTLTTLQSMNVNMADLAKAFTAKPPVSEPAATSPASQTAATPNPSNAFEASPSSLFTPKPEATDPQSNTPNGATAEASSASATSSAGQPAVDPMQWWGALTQQFQGIAAAALKDVAGEAMKAGMSAKNANAKSTATAKTPRKASATSTTARGQSAKPSSAKSPSAKPAKSVRAAVNKKPTVAAKKPAGKPATRAARTTALK